MARKKSSESSEKELHWRKIVQRQADSGQSVRQFCSSAGVSEPSFYAWRKKLRERTTNGSGQRKTTRRGNASENLFVPLKLLDPSPALEIVHPLGYRIQVTGEVNAVTLQKVIAVLDERGGR